MIPLNKRGKSTEQNSGKYMHLGNFFLKNTYTYNNFLCVYILLNFSSNWFFLHIYVSRREKWYNTDLEKKSVKMLMDFLEIHWSEPTVPTTVVNSGSINSVFREQLTNQCFIYDVILKLAELWWIVLRKQEFL